MFLLNRSQNDICHCIRTMFEKYKLINTFRNWARFTATQRQNACAWALKQKQYNTKSKPKCMKSNLMKLNFIFLIAFWWWTATRADTTNIRLLGIIRDTIRASHSSKTADCWETALQKAHTMGIYPNDKTWVDLYYEIWMVHLELTIVSKNAFFDCETKTTNSQ